MRKQTKTVVNRKQKLYNSIMESISPEIQKIIKEAEKDNDEDDDKVDEGELNELFGFGSSVKKPEKALSIDNTDDENADLFIQWCAYFMSQASNNVQKGLDSFFTKFGNVIKAAPMIVIKGILKLMSGGIKATAYGCATIGAVVLGSIALISRLATSGVKNAKEALDALYKNISAGILTFYKNFVNGADKFATDSKDKLTVWSGVVSAALVACANKIQGAVEAFGDFFKKVLADAKKKVDGAILLAKTWLQTKSDEVKKYISDVAGDIRSTVVEAWNALDKKVRTAYNDVVKKLEDWMNTVKDFASYAGLKIADAAKAAKDFTVDTKDKALVWGILKGVKGLSKKYTEDEVVALVRKCYNESLVAVNGKYHINESYFYDRKTRRNLKRI